MSSSLTLDATINPPGSESLYDNFHFSQAVCTGQLVLCSGQLGTSADGRIPVELADEFRNAWRAIGNVLAARGLNHSHIVEYTTFHVGLASTLAAFMKVRDEFIAAPWPAWTAIGISELAVPGAHVEIRVTAQLPP